MKLVVTGICLVAVVGLVFVSPKADNRGPNWLYRGGKSDPFYWIPFNSDGSLRRYTKPVLIVWVLLCLVGFWLLW